MSSFAELPKAYDASGVEDAIYAAWEKSGVFNPDQLPGERIEPYCIVMPPPNRTGTLHMGHATMLAIEDLMIRFQRMAGKKTLWIPGTDHAAIATQVKVEQLLVKQGMKDPRNELGREKFLEKVKEFAEESGRTINNQVRKMGSSCDWSRERYTFDEARNMAVNEMFKMMFEDGIIERGYRLVNWDPQFQTTLSDDEVLTKETTAKLLTFTYDKDFPITISTTRPETKFGDTAVAVHPTDERYQKFIGQTFTPTFCGKLLTIKVIADEAVDPTFGTGALGVTPAHSMIDAEMAERHNLNTIPVIGKDGKMLAEVGADFDGLTVKQARVKVEEMLVAQGLLQKVEEIPQNLPIAERGGAPVEQLPMRQWFIRVNKPFALRQDTLNKWKRGEMVTLKQLMREAVESKQTTIVPERFDKIYFHWIDNLRDWCISRQIWFGHQIPVWYRTEDDQEEMVASAVSPGSEWTQDPDTLDTWFSSGMWTFSALGWPNVDEWNKMKEYHPTAVLETGYDILFFWVARMILMSTYALGEVPFKDVYLHGLVRDEQGRKMSKSIGNIIDPLDVIPKYGTDAVRLSLVLGTTPGNDMRLSEEKIAGFRNFTNKLWNISRFILMQIGENLPQPLLRKEGGIGSLPPYEGGIQGGGSLADRWILARLTNVVASVTKKIEAYELSSAGEELRDFTWGDLADWYLEIAKIEKEKGAILSHILKTMLTLWHPFMPFVTEYIWSLAGFERQLIVAPWPKMEQKDEVTNFERLRALVTDMRRLRNDNGVDTKARVPFVVWGPEAETELMKQNVHFSELAKASELRFKEPAASEKDQWRFAVSGSCTVGVFFTETKDLEKEKANVEKELEEVKKYVASITVKLQNEDFISKAPARVVDEMKAKLADAEAKCAALEARLV